MQSSIEKKKLAKEEFEKHHEDGSEIFCDVIISSNGKKLVRVWNKTVAVLYAYDTLVIMKSFKMKPMKKD